jgi:hypothetical protein
MVDLVVSSRAVNFLVEGIQVVRSMVESVQVVGLEAFERRRVWSFAAW